MDKWTESLNLKLFQLLLEHVPKGTSVTSTWAPWSRISRILNASSQTSFTWKKVYRRVHNFLPRWRKLRQRLQEETEAAVALPVYWEVMNEVFERSGFDPAYVYSPRKKRGLETNETIDESDLDDHELDRNEDSSSDEGEDYWDTGPLDDDDPDFSCDVISVASGSGVEAELLDSNTAAGPDARDPAADGDLRVDQRYLRFLPGHSATVNTSNEGHLVSPPATTNTSSPIRSPAAADTIDLDTPPPSTALAVIDLSLDSPAPSAAAPAAVPASTSSDWTEEMIITCLQLGDDKNKSQMTWREVAETFYGRFGLRFTEDAIRNRYRLFRRRRDERERARLRRAARRQSLTEPYLASNAASVSGSTVKLKLRINPTASTSNGVDGVAPAHLATRRITRSLSRPAPQECQTEQVNHDRRILEFGDAKAQNPSLRWTDLANEIYQSFGRVVQGDTLRKRFGDLNDLRRRKRLANGMTAAAGGQWTHELKQRILKFGDERLRDPKLLWGQLADELYLEHGFLRSAKNVAQMYRKLKRFPDWSG
ncbi:hypothetical protein HDU96_003790 [Phlyctochytrium bullatum]|nr:hypothetical protein HDU96_003790 [Phlyctochytrium bullatum]